MNTTNEQILSALNTTLAACKGAQGPYNEGFRAGLGVAIKLLKPKVASTQLAEPWLCEPCAKWLNEPFAAHKEGQVCQSCDYPRTKGNQPPAALEGVQTLCPLPSATELIQTPSYGFDAQMAHYPDPPPQGCCCEACKEAPEATGSQEIDHIVCCQRCGVHGPIVAHITHAGKSLGRVCQTCHDQVLGGGQDW